MGKTREFFGFYNVLAKETCDDGCVHTSYSVYGISSGNLHPLGNNLQDLGKVVDVFSLNTNGTTSLVIRSFLESRGSMSVGITSENKWVADRTLNSRETSDLLKELHRKWFR